MKPAGWDGFAEFSRQLASRQKVGRPTLRREWSELRRLAERVRPVVSEQLVKSLLGKSWATTEPEENDLKALVSYAVGRGLVEAEELHAALLADNTHAPLYWLAGLSGKSFGENVAPQLCAYWIQDEGDLWIKQSGREYYDIAWSPHEELGVNRLELKASSESPAFRFQQIRDPRHTARAGGDYDTLLCLGITASTMEFWSIPAERVGVYIDNGTFANQHGGTKMKSNTYWFVVDVRTRKILRPFSAEATEVRRLLVDQMPGHGPV